MDVELLKEAATDIRNYIKEDMFKGTKPFRQDPVPERQQLYNYMNIPEDKKNFARYYFPDHFPLYEQKMQKLMEKYNA